MKGVAAESDWARRKDNRIPWGKVHRAMGRLTRKQQRDSARQKQYLSRSHHLERGRGSVEKEQNPAGRLVE